MDSWKTKYLFPAMGMIPIDRTGGDKRRRRSTAAEAVLRRGELFGIFPEGTRSRDGRLLQGPHRRGPAGARGRLPDLPGRHHGHRPHPAARRQGAEAATGRARSRSAGRSEPALRGDAPSTIALAPDDRRGDVRDPRADRARSTSTCTPGRTPRRVRRCAPRPPGARRRGARSGRRVGRHRPRRARRRGELITATAAATAGGAGGRLRRLRAMTAHDHDHAPRWFGPRVPGRHHRGSTSPASIGKRLAKAAVAAAVDGNEGDLGAPAARRRPGGDRHRATPRPGATCCATRRRT